MDSIFETLERGDNNKVKGSLDNCITVLRRDPVLKGAICKNQMTGRIDIVKPVPWKRNGVVINDTDEFQIHWYFEKNYQIFNERNINKSIRIIAGENQYHPVKQKLESLKWDGVERINTLLTKFLGVEDSKYAHEVMHILMQALIHRVYVPGCKFEIMVCLVGGQGAGKSTFFRFLAINDDWFSDDLKRLDDEKVFRKLQGHWLIEMSEMLATATARSIEDIKSFLSRQKDSYKIPYETHPEDRARQCVFVGTSNNLNFLPLDRSGNRRFAPVKVNPERVDKHILEDEEESREYILQAWAEAMEEYKNSEKHTLKFTKETEEYLKDLQTEFMPEDTKVGVVQEWLDMTKNEYVCTNMIFSEALGRDGEPKNYEAREINEIMNESIIGWEKGPSHRFNRYGVQRSWKRIKDSLPAYLQIADDEDIPFD